VKSQFSAACLFTLFSLFAFTAEAKKIPACSPELPKDTVCEIRINELAPTQPDVGKYEVKLKRSQYEKVSGKKAMEKLKLEKTAPVVIGPDGRYYLVDHHHTSLALLESGEKYSYVKVLENWSDIGDGKPLNERMIEFWEKMKGNQYCFLKTADGTIIDPLSQLFPKTLKACGNNRYRALTYLLIEKKIITGIERNYFEFYVADELRKLGVVIKPGRLKAAIKNAERLLKTPEGLAAIARADSPNCYLEMIQALVTRP
jgi:hypothetical protein